MRSSNQSHITEGSSLQSPASLELLDTPWATLTSTVKAKLQQLQPGQMLLIKVDDPLARLDVPAWCALTGNVLQATSLENDGTTLFFIRKETKRR